MMNRVEELTLQLASIEDKIRRLENDLKKPLSSDIEEHAVEESDLTLLSSLYEVEKKNLARVKQQIMQNQY
jgi:hypothetical protein